MRKIKTPFKLPVPYLPSNVNNLPQVVGHDCNFPEVTKQLLTMCSGYQKTIALLYMEIETLKSLLQKDLGYEDEDFAAAMPKGEDLKATYDDVEKIIAEFMNADGTATGVENIMKKWGFPVEKFEFQNRKQNEESGAGIGE